MTDTNPSRPDDDPADEGLGERLRKADGDRTEPGSADLGGGSDLAPEADEDLPPSAAS